MLEYTIFGLSIGYFSYFLYQVLKGDNQRPNSDYRDWLIGQSYSTVDLVKRLLRDDGDKEPTIEEIEENLNWGITTYGSKEKYDQVLRNYYN